MQRGDERWGSERGGLWRCLFDLQVRFAVAKSGSMYYEDDGNAPVEI